jgi:hypothetical protein
LAQLPQLSQEMRSTQVLVRFCLRMIILAVFATFGSFGFAHSLAALLAMSIIFSVVVAVIKRERPLDGILNHWDEALTCAALFCLVHTFSELGLGALAPV